MAKRKMDRGISLYINLLLKMQLAFLIRYLKLLAFIVLHKKSKLEWKILT